ncbi:MAG TPA: glucoamylase family protein [Bryobacteraceae bacterium]|nr:glucoamylase family protein [Bryobacteraceae bacterium]
MSATTMVSPSVEAELTPAEKAALRTHAVQAAKVCGWVNTRRRCAHSRELFRESARRLNRLERELYQLETDAPSDDLQWLYDNLRLVRTDIQDLDSGTRILSKLPAVKTEQEDCIPRPVVLSRALLDAAEDRLTQANFYFFIQSVEEIEPLRLAELGAMLPALKLVLLERLALRGFDALNAFRTDGAKAPPKNVGRLVRSLRFIGEIDWKETIEQLSIVHRILCLDPAGVYPRMEFESREQYRKAVAEIAGHSDVGEAELARTAVSMGESATVDREASDSLRHRLRHVGYYLVDETGSERLLRATGYRPGFGASVQRMFRRFPDEIYIIGIEFVTLLTVVALIMSVVRTQGGWGLLFGAFLLILPATQAAVEVMNYLVTAVLTARPLPKLDFSKGVPADCATMIAIPTLLLNEKQIRELVDDLEVRYLVNRDRHIFFALLTDLPDTAEPAGDKDARIDLVISLIEELNRKYSGEPWGGFYLFHRHRIYNPREGAWMGWERKRGKLLDLNQLLRNVYDPFPVKAGDMSALPRIRYVLTLDSDTQLPPGSANRMIGALAHPLNRALVDPELNIVTQGYGILQPRVGISVHSAVRSRLATIYSGQTGFDIYSRAVSDVYQDLYGEGIFTGKGIYEVDALRKVLEHRFPRNALLSHDLIEGAYARAGLVSDIEVIDDYPSHYSAFNRRKHRWLRGDWQIVRWIFNKVPDESRVLVPNPISLVSRWKIVDNLRRSVMEPATFFLLIAGWFLLPGGPVFWTLVTLALLFLPIYFRLLFALIRALTKKDRGAVQESISDFGTAHISILLNIAFLAHQALVALDAIVRTVVRSTVTHSRLLEWETATEAELGINKRTPVDIYLDWVPAVALGIGALLFLRPQAAPAALPFILVWCFSKAISIWINRSPRDERYRLTSSEHRFIRDVALKSWKYFSDFSNERNHWLIPDNVQQEPYRVAERISPTNIGFLLNVRQAALEFGYLTVSEFAELTDRTLSTMSKMPRKLGHFVNWYDTVTLQPLEPQFVSSVDSGNLVASLWSLKQGCLELLRQPVVRQNASEGLLDFCRADSAPQPKRDRMSDAASADVWLAALLASAPEKKDSPAYHRFAALEAEVRRFLPWHLPEYSAVRGLPELTLELPHMTLTPGSAEAYYEELDKRLELAAVKRGVSPEVQAAMQRLRRELPECREQMKSLARRLRGIAAVADRFVNDMSFATLTDKRRNLLSIGLDVAANELAKSCYDLLASEARIATFVAVAKNEAPQEVWFRLGRQHTAAEGENVLISWTGTMFEYLMPAIWMNSQPNTLLDKAVRGALRVHQRYGERRRIPWGISEAAYSKRDADGNYQYAAFGVPGLALNVARAGSLVVSPYSSCLALPIDPMQAVRNLRMMANRGWLAEFGFFESADFTNHAARRFGSRKYDLVQCWMAHHQGMSLTSICNLLFDAPFQRWFHGEPLVQANELILQERPLRVKPITDTQPKRVLSFTRNLIPARLRAPA